MAVQPLDALPIWLIYLLTVLIGILIVDVGFRAGRYWKTRHGIEKQENLGALVGSTLALLAFLLAFMISIATNRFDNRRQLVIAEANAIGTLYLRTGYLDEPDRTDIRTWLREYVDLRLLAVADPSQLASARTRAEDLQMKMWGRAEALARAQPDSDMVAIYIQALNEVIDLQTSRLAAASARIPLTTWLTILTVAFLTLAMVGFGNGISGNRHLIVQVALVMVFAAVIFLIVDLDRPTEGLLTVSQQPLIDLQQQLPTIDP